MNCQYCVDTEDKETAVDVIVDGPQGAEGLCMGCLPQLVLDYLGQGNLTIMKVHPRGPDNRDSDLPLILIREYNP